jgi:hypothetical protein
LVIFARTIAVAMIAAGRMNMVRVKRVMGVLYVGFGVAGM